MTPGKGRMTAPAGRRDNHSRREPDGDRSHDRDTTRRAFARRWRACCRGSWRLGFALAVLLAACRLSFADGLTEYHTDGPKRVMHRAIIGAIVLGAFCWERSE